VNFTVVWRESLLDKLAELYLAASEIDRERMAQGIEGLNRRLAEDPP